MFGIIEMFMSPKRRAEMRRQHQEWVETKLKEAVPWDPKMRWEKTIAIKADTYKPYSLFDVVALDSNNIAVAAPENLVISPEGEWAYCEKIVRRGGELYTFKGTAKGTVMFDGPVIVPSLHKRVKGHVVEWNQSPMMSLTPMEIWTLRAGTRAAKGHTIVAGLGLGHQLMDVANKKSVTKVTLVEKSKDLVDWIMPQLYDVRLGKPFLPKNKSIEVVVGDAYEEIPKMEADVALMDIFPGYGGNREDCEGLMRKAKGVKRWWIWGSQSMGGSLWD